MKNEAKLRKVKRLRLIIGWFGVLTPVFGSGVLVGVSLMDDLTAIFAGQVVFASTVNFFVGRMLLKPVPLNKGKRVKA